MRSNTSPGGLSLSTNNLIYGQSLNPHHFKRAVGGSNGADAAMVAAKCVPFAIGCDQLGSMKYAATFNGTVALKVSRNRCTTEGVSFPNKVGFE